MTSPRSACPIDERTRALVDRLERCTLSRLDHADHVRVAWSYLTQADIGTVLCELPERLRRYAASKGLPEAYHETITFAFVILIHERIAERPGAAWEVFAAANPDLFERSLLERYYAKDVLESERARRVFLLPGPRPR